MGNVGHFKSDDPLFWLVLVLKVCSCPSNAQSQLNSRILICCTCHLRGCSPFFPLLRLASSAYKSLLCLIPTLTWGGESSHLFGLTCSVVLWRGRDTVNKHHWDMWGVLTVNAPQGGCHSRRQHVLPNSMLSGFQVFCEGPVPQGSWFQAMTLLADKNCPVSQEDMVSNQQTAHSSADVVCGAKIAEALSFPLLAVTHLPLWLWGKP